ncbi:LysR family transcriptional regulator [Aliidiomarina sp. Khilg15.8]
MTKQALPSLNALRVFAVVARCKSFKGAAEELGVTQSAVSRQIQTLEDQLGMRVFQRDNRLHALTPAGELLAPELQRTFARLHELINKVKQSEAADARLLRIGISAELLRWWLGPRLQEFYALYPHLQLQFEAVDEYTHKGNSHSLMQQLTTDALDIVVTLGSLESKQLQTTVLSDTQLVLHMHQNCTYTPEQPLSVPLYQVQHSHDHDDWTRQQQPPLTLRQAQSTSMALDLASLHEAALLIPHHYKAASSAYPALQAVNDGAVPGAAALRAFHSRHKDNELAVVAFIQWLQHIAQR